MNNLFRKFTQGVCEASGSSWAFLTVFALILVWAITGAMFHFSEAWQLVINTGTSIVTLLMVFFVQNAQNRNAKATHLKLDELIHSIGGARNRLIAAEDLSDADIKKDKDKFSVIAQNNRSPKNEKT